MRDETEKCIQDADSSPDDVYKNEQSKSKSKKESK